MIQSYQGKFPQLGKNVYIAPTATVVGDVILGDDVSVWPSAVIRGDMNTIIIGARTNVQDGAVIHVDVDTPVVIGCDVTIGHLAHVHGATVEDEVLIGSASIVLDKALIKTHAMVAAGALVTPNKIVDSNTLVAGVPAIVKRNITEDEIKHIRSNAAEYIYMKNQYLLDEKNNQ
jgi:carbonic anhydrase/acetyltransferase-like protein (isoleucine patch superfamily)